MIFNYSEDKGFSSIFSKKKTQKTITHEEVGEWQALKELMEETGQSADEVAEQLGGNISESVLEYARSTDVAEQSQDGLTASVNKSGNVFDTLKSKAKGALAGIASGIASAGVSMLVGFAVEGVIALIDHLNNSIEEQKEELKELREEYDALKDELTSLENEIQANTDAINTLQAEAEKGTITLVEEDQLKKLRLQNTLLQEQLTLKQDLEKEKAEELISGNRETFNNEFGGSVDDSYNNSYDIKEHYTPGISTYENAPGKNLVLLAMVNQAKLKEAVSSGDEELIKVLEADKLLITKELDERSSDMLKSLIEYQDNLMAVMNEDGTFDDESNQQLWDYIES